MEDVELARIEKVQKRLTAALVNQAKDLKISKKDWIQGGWTRSDKGISDKVEIGLTPETIRQ